MPKGIPVPYVVISSLSCLSFIKPVQKDVMNVDQSNYLQLHGRCQLQGFVQEHLAAFILVKQLQKFQESNCVASAKLALHCTSAQYLPS